jgi:hypothetical protein
MVTTVERMVDKKVGLWSQGQRQTHQHKFKAPSPQIQPETRRENKCQENVQIGKGRKK